MARALIFDSGVGGLSVSAEIRSRLPDLKQIYVADDAFRPYGEKSESALRKRLPGLIRTLSIMTKPDIIVLACNTASTAALDAIRAEADMPVVGVVPAIKPAAEKSDKNVIGVLGTPGTVRHKYVDGLINRHAAHCRVMLHGSTQLVTQAENKLAGMPVDMTVVENEIRPFFENEPGQIPDQIVLACTHFPLLRAELSQAASRPVSWVDSGTAIARRTESLLGVKGADKRPGKDLAFLIGPPTSKKRRSAFSKFGFDSVVGLMPESKLPD